MPRIAERLGWKHIHVDHLSTQLLTGHGAFKVYLHKQGRVADSACNNCGEEDTPYHVLVECPVHEDERLRLRVCHLELGLQWPADLSTIVGDEHLFQAARVLWAAAKQQREV